MDHFPRFSLISRQHGSGVIAATKRPHVAEYILVRSRAAGFVCRASISALTPRLVPDQGTINGYANASTADGLDEVPFK
jgi:hypothetical protein